jgi:hypothetical protein
MNMTIKKNKKTLGVGQLVSVPVGARTFHGKIAEDRGKIGVQGRKLYRIAVMIDGELVNIELPEDQIRSSGLRVTGKKRIQAKSAVRVLKRVEKA